MAPVSTKVEIDEINRRLAAVETKTAVLENVVLIGGAEPSHREVIRLMEKFLSENERLPEEVRAQGRWIQNVNRAIWIAITVMIGIFL